LPFRYEKNVTVQSVLGEELYEEYEVKCLRLSRTKSTESNNISKQKKFDKTFENGTILSENKPELTSSTPTNKPASIDDSQENAVEATNSYNQDYDKLVKNEIDAATLSKTESFVPTTVETITTETISNHQSNAKSTSTLVENNLNKLDQSYLQSGIVPQDKDKMSKDIEKGMM